MINYVKVSNWYKFRQWFLSEFNKIYKYIIYKIIKIKKSYKPAILYISEKYKKIIIAPYYFNKDGINYEQDICYVFDLNIDNETLGKEILNALNKFEYNNKKDIINNKLSDWPSFKYSELNTVKSFMENYKYISINDENGYLNFSVKYPLGNEYGYSKKITDIKNNVEYYDIGKKIREIYTMSEEDI
jgi:hypothetical protein